MNKKQRTSIQKLIDEAERTYLALLDGPLAQGDYKSLGRAIKNATEQITQADTPSKCYGSGACYCGDSRLAGVHHLDGCLLYAGCGKWERHGNFST